MLDELQNLLEMQSLDEDEVLVWTLTDEEGVEHDFELLDVDDVDGKTYCALSALDEETDEYIILRAEKDENNLLNATMIEDDDEFERVSAYFDDKLYGDVDLDA